MALQGSLQTMSVPEILMWISQSRKTGTLQIKAGDLTEKLSFEDGVLTYSASSNRDNSLGQLLIRKGVVTEEMHKQARSLRRRSSVAVAKALTELQILSEEDVLRFLRKKAEKELFELFRCEQGDFRFDEKEMPKLDLLPMRVDVSQILLKITQQMDEKGEYDFDSTGIRLDL